MFQLQKVPSTICCVHDVIKITSIISVGEELEAIAPLQTPQSNDGHHFHLELVAPVFYTPRPMWLGVRSVLLLWCASFFIRQSVLFSLPDSVCTECTKLYDI